MVTELFCFAMGVLTGITVLIVVCCVFIDVDNNDEES